MQQHAFVIEAEIEEGVMRASNWIQQELGLVTEANPDIFVLKYGLFSVEDARRAQEVAMQAPLRGESKVLIIAASRAYHEAQNALLKLFEEPPAGTYLFLILPSLGGLLPTLRSRVQVLRHTENRKQKTEKSDVANEFIRMSREKRSALIKKLATGKDEEERREHRDTAMTIINGVEAALVAKSVTAHVVTLSDIATLRGYLHERSAPVKMIMEHLSIVMPNI